MPQPSSGSPPEVDLLQGSAGADPALDVALPHALIRLVADGRHRPVVRSYLPTPTVAFGRRDAFLPGFPAAAAAARRRGFTPVIRGAGGRAAAYHEGCLVLDEIMPSGDSIGGIHERFSAEARRQAAALRALGIDARVGEVPGEYCPGEFSVNAGGRVKLIGAAQRIIRGAWLLSSVVVVEGAATLRAVLEDTYDALELDWNPETTGAVADEAPGVNVEDVRGALLSEYGRRYPLVPTAIDADALRRAGDLIERHRVEP
jgi:octanoyl-[GcvH]:protein N-octanoyltransferase